ncbi:MAG: malonyl-[acyl-carrier protein] O-methyltransferase BioC, partial [Gammaproteobacteria bacterium]
MSDPDLRYQLPTAKVRRGFERAASGYDAVAVLQREVADRLLQRLDYVKLKPQRILDLGAGTGYALPALRQRYPK